MNTLDQVHFFDPSGNLPNLCDIIVLSHVELLCLHQIHMALFIGTQNVQVNYQVFGKIFPFKKTNLQN